VSHFLLMVVHAALVAIFFSLLSRQELRARVLLFAQIFIGMVGIALVIAWLMYPFPSGPPTPFP
jgi:hypothetical protein